jgi:hypothetical protein
MKAAILAGALAMATTAAALVAPVNDDFADRIAITGTAGSVSGTVEGATIECGEPVCANNNTVWWTWTPPAHDIYQIDTLGSDFNTFLDVFIGDTLTGLVRQAQNDDALGTAQSAVCIAAGPETELQIQVSGSSVGDVGDVLLNWSTVTEWSDWIPSHCLTNTCMVVAFGSDLSALSLWRLEKTEAWYRTNMLGCEEWRYEDSFFHTNGITILDRKLRQRVGDKLPEGIGLHFSFQDYNGSQVLLYDPDSEKLMVYAVKSGAFVQQGEQMIVSFGNAYFVGSEIHAFISGGGMEGLRVFDKKLKKEKWSVPLAAGDIRTIGKTLVARYLWDNSTLEITCMKKGKKIAAQHSLSNVPQGASHIEHDPKGGALYWKSDGNTNFPLTYLDRKGRRIVDYQALPDIGNVWSFQNFDGKRLYIAVPLGGVSNTVYVYKVKGLANVGMKTLECGVNVYANRKAYLFTFSGADDGLIVCDWKLKKEKWNVPFAPGDIYRLGKKTFYRKIRTTVGDTVTDTYTLFDKKGEIVTYEFSYPK